MYISLHQDNPFEFNVGYYFVRAGETTSGRDPLAAERIERFFAATLGYLRAHEEAFDQKLINCLMKSYSQSMDRIYHGQLSRAGCKGQKISLSDKTLKPLTDGAKEKKQEHQKGVAPIREGSSARKNKHPQFMTWALLEIDDILSHATPLMSRDTSIVHVLTNVPLTAATGKKVVAKELMVWEGADCYYCVGNRSAPPLGVKSGLRRMPSSVGAASRARYLAYDGPIVATNLIDSSGTSQSGSNPIERLAAAVLQLVAAAIVTGRVLILPTLMHDGRFVRLWEMLDLVSLEHFVAWRETSFLKNPRLRVSSDATAARALLSRATATMDFFEWGTDLPIRPAQTYALSPVSRPNARERPADRSEVWSALVTAPEAAAADLLLLSFDRTFPLPEADCFKGNLLPCPHLVPQWQQDGMSATPTAISIPSVPPFLPVLASSMRWCMVSRSCETFSLNVLIQLI